MLGIRLAGFLAGARDFTRPVRAAARRALEGFFWRDGQLMLSILDDLRPVFEVWTPAADRLGDGRRSPGLPDDRRRNVWPLDVEEAEANGDLLANAQDPLTPQTLLLIERRQAPEPC